MNTLLFILISFFISPDCEQMEEVRKNYGNINSEKQLLSFIHQVESISCKKVKPYMASATMQKAQFAIAPWTKYKFFLTGKSMLEDYISANPDDIDARYIRFLIQSHAPFFLGYYKEKEKDAQFILKNIDQSDLSRSYVQQIKMHIEQFR